jgi:ABC-type polysaccharide/polyol phosphate export permease
MSTLTVEAPVAPSAVATPAHALSGLGTVIARRFALTARTPREIAIPLVTPIMFALVIAPALAKTVGAFRPGIDYKSFVALATAGLLVPLNMMFAGVGVIVDRESGARRDVLAAPLARPLVVIGNLVVALAVTAGQLGALFLAAELRGSTFSISATGVLWALAGALLLGVGMYGVAEVLANRMPSVEEYIAAVPAIAIVPWFFAGSLFPLPSLPGALAGFAKVLPLTHALALIRYGLLDKRGTALHDIWGLSSAPEMAALSLGVVAAFAVVLTGLAIRVFMRAATR